MNTPIKLDFTIASIEKPFQLCSFLQINFTDLQDIINDSYYTTYSIPKKRGGSREINNPCKELKLVHKSLLNLLQDYYIALKPIDVHGFTRGNGCNIFENAKVHVNQKYVLNIDLLNFFPSIKAKRVNELFSSSLFSMNENLALAMTLLTTEKGKLPTGASTSPVISNFICLEMDKELKNLCISKNLNYSRYADDLTFSSNNAISEIEIQEIYTIIRSNKFELNEKKFRLKTSNRKQTVTGLTVNTKVNVDRKLIRKVRAMLHDSIKNGIEIATVKHFNSKMVSSFEMEILFLQRLLGYINFIGQIKGKKDPIYLNFKLDFEYLREENYF